MQKALSGIGPLNYCYIVKDGSGVSKNIGRAKFQAFVDATGRLIGKDEAILAAR